MTLLERGTGGGPILDYAGPAARRALRLPAQSRIEVLESPPGDARLVIRETLAGQGGAVLALLFAAFTFWMLLSLELQLGGKWPEHLAQMLLVAVVMGAEVFVGALVVNNTWRKTLLTVTPQDLSVTFAAPFTGKTHFRFPCEMVASVQVTDVEPLPGAALVPELEIRLWNAPSVRLFTGHRHADLFHLAELFQQVQPLAPAPEQTRAP